MLLNNASAISPDHEPHKNLEVEVIDYLKSNNYCVTETTYHAAMPVEISALLRRRYSMTALHIRTRADRIAIHKIKPIEFEIEMKTDTGRYPNLALEALPLIHHRINAHIGVRCLYACRVNGRDFGFWNHGELNVLKIQLPTADRRYSEQTLNSIEKLAVKMFGNIIVVRSNSSGTNDPFVIIDSQVIQTMPHWRDLIDSQTDLTVAGSS